MDETIVIISIVVLYIGFKIYCGVVLFSSKRTIKELQQELISVRGKLAHLEQQFTSSTNTVADLARTSVERQTAQYASVFKEVKDEQLSAPKTVHTPAKTKSTVQQRNFLSDSPFSLWIKKQCSIESVISKLGILLLLIGIGFVFKLAHERGFIGKTIILAIGCAAGFILTGAGFFVRRKNRIILSQVLFGGSIAVLYLTAFAAYIRYNVLNDFSAFIFFAIITLFAYFLAAAVSSPAVSIIGLVGSLFIPFILGFDFFNLLSFGVYVFAVSVLSMLLYSFKRWRILQFSSSISFFGVLIWLLSKTQLTGYDAQLFLLLVLLLWIIHLIPDFYFHLAEKESDSDKLYSPLAAVINYGFSLFFAYNLSSYHPLPEGSVYFVFIFFYSLFSYICLKKEKLATLGYAYIALTILSIYITITDLLNYDTRPAAVLGLAVFLTWLWRKTLDKNLIAALHTVALTGYGMALYVLLSYHAEFSSQSFAIHASLYAVPMTVLVFFQKHRNRLIAQTLVFQLYTATAIYILLKTVLHEQRYMLFGFQFEYYHQTLLYILVFLALFSVYSILHYYGKQNGKKVYFYESSLYVLPILTCVFIVGYEIEQHTISILFPVIVQLCTAGGLLALSFFKLQNDRNRLVYRAVCLSIIFKLLLIDGTRTAHNIHTFFMGTAKLQTIAFFHWGIVGAGLFVYLIDRFYPQDSTAVKHLKTVGKIIIGVIILIYYPIIYFPTMWSTKAVQSAYSLFGIRILPLVVNICNALLFLKILTNFITVRRQLFYAITLIFIFLSITDVYLATKNNGLLTVIWGFYSIAAFIYFLKKADRTLVYTSLGFIVFVAAKLVIIDLYTISMLSKTITSIILGIALLVLSYAVQPMIKKFEHTDS